MELRGRPVRERKQLERNKREQGSSVETSRKVEAKERPTRPVER
jgi:hypothetical protein